MKFARKIFPDDRHSHWIPRGLKGNQNIKVQNLRGCQNGTDIFGHIMGVNRNEHLLVEYNGRFEKEGYGLSLHITASNSSLSSCSL
jgi:hypothetical protein